LREDEKEEEGRTFEKEERILGGISLEIWDRELQQIIDKASRQQRRITVESCPESAYLEQTPTRILLATDSGPAAYPHVENHLSALLPLDNGHWRA
jgi:hypothetical protein